jgi:hypothetical protein
MPKYVLTFSKFNPGELVPPKQHLARVGRKTNKSTSLHKEKLKVNKESFFMD